MVGHAVWWFRMLYRGSVLRFFLLFFLLVGCADAKAPTGCDCETAYQQCRKQNGCNNYYRFLTERMIKRIWAGGSNPGAGSSNPCATCVSIINS